MVGVLPSRDRGDPHSLAWEESRLSVSSPLSCYHVIREKKGIKYIDLKSMALID